MPIVTMPDGTDVDFGDMPDDQIRGMIQQKFPDETAAHMAPPPTRSTLSDVAIEGAKGLGRGLADLSGDLNEAITGPFTRGDFQRLAYDLGLSKTDPGPIPAPYGQQIAKTLGIEATPQTTAGKYAGSVGQMLGNPATYAGPGGLASKTLAGIASGAGSEAAGELTGDNPLARLAGSVLPGMITGRVARAIGTPSRVPAPTTEDLFDSAEQHYNAMHGFGVEVHPQVMDDVATNMTTALKAQGFYPTVAPKTFGMIEELRNPDGPTFTTGQIEAIRRGFGKVGPDLSDREAARQVIGEIDNTMAGLTPADAAVNGHFAPRVAQEARLARGDYAAAKQAEQIENTTDRAELTAASTGSGSNIDNALRQKFRQVLTSPKLRRGYSADELDAMDQLVRGTSAGNAARLLGKLAPSGIVSGALGIGLGHAVGHTFGVPALGYVSKAYADSQTRGLAARLSEMRRLRSPEAIRRGSSPLPPQVPMIPRAAISAAKFGLPALEQP